MLFYTHFKSHRFNVKYRTLIQKVCVTRNENENKTFQIESSQRHNFILNTYIVIFTGYNSHDSILELVGLHMVFNKRRSLTKLFQDSL